ncbi:efflux RND transporter periplasmic adaptor subunit [Pigmentiphaga sp. H8]|uniref:efflux RND transporter periplasmic adaptor subunit n=1 Tax=unclassified Pigmentiphaga TaxID=2626614 RepID=UPI000F5AE8FC|nr:efflux RND transporter periplasmic adaptor subunit [Pigmentiphaga sp. H8]AZG08043.1 efflux RND transporter periplasmic adaptor subunit [Pigmentiphaga sp. H8]
MQRKRRSPYLLGAVSLATLLALSACGKGNGGAQQGAGAPPPMEIGTVTITPTKEVIVNELPGRLEATRIAEVRARVAGIVLQRVFREGSDVKAGQLLFKIDPAPFQADYNSAKANLERDQANLYQARMLAERYEPLVKANAVSKQEYDNAVASYKQAQAAVSATKAALDRAKLSLDYATVTAPISGRIGRALVTEGALVGQGEVTPLAVIQRLDPVYANFTQSVAQLSQLRAAFDSGKIKQVAPNEARVSLVLDDGSRYPLTGKLLFSDVTVDQSTGQVTLRAEFPNPNNVLLPGMYVRVRVEQGIDEAALTVPQQAVQRGANGDASVYVVGAENKIEPRQVKTGAAVGDRWIITQGLKPNDVVIVEGFQKVRPGAQVKPVPWKPAAESAPAQPAGQQGSKS